MKLKKKLESILIDLIRKQIYSDQTVLINQNSLDKAIKKIEDLLQAQKEQG